MTRSRGEADEQTARWKAMRDTAERLPAAIGLDDVYDLAERAAGIEELTLEGLAAMPAVSRAFELAGQLHERMTALGDATADIDDVELSVAVWKARHWIQVAGERAARLHRRDQGKREAARLAARKTTRGAGSPGQMNADAPR